MSIKALVCAALAASAATPALALTPSQVIHHSGGPVPYSELASSASGTGPATYGGHGRRRHASTEPSAADVAAPSGQAAGNAYPSDSASSNAGATSPLPPASGAPSTPALPSQGSSSASPPN